MTGRAVRAELEKGYNHGIYTEWAVDNVEREERRAKRVSMTIFDTGMRIGVSMWKTSKSLRGFQGAEEMSNGPEVARIFQRSFQLDSTIWTLWPSWRNGSDYHVSTECQLHSSYYNYYCYNWATLLLSLSLSLCLSLSPSFSKRYLHSLKPIRASVLTDSSNVSPVLNLYIFPIYSYTLQSWRLFSFLLSLSLSICVNIIALLLYTPTYTPSHRHTGTEEAPYFTMLSGKLWRNFNRLTLGWWVKFWDFRQSPPKALL